MYRIIEEKVENLPIIPECKQLLANLIYSDVYPVLSREDKEYWESLRVEHEQSDCGNNYCVLSIPVLKKMHIFAMEPMASKNCYIQPVEGGGCELRKSYFLYSKIKN